MFLYCSSHGNHWTLPKFLRHVQLATARKLFEPVLMRQCPLYGELLEYDSDSDDSGDEGDDGDDGNGDDS